LIIYQKLISFMRLPHDLELTRPALNAKPTLRILVKMQLNSVLRSFLPLLLFAASGNLLAQDAHPDQGSNYGQQPYADSVPARQPLAASQLEQLVAPIALYPDALVAQVLAASTYPQQVADADQWRQAQGNATPDQIAYGADGQNWDPSIKALTAFPQVLAQMDRNLQWTSDLGNAYYNQPQDVLEAVQVMRQRAQSAGTLRSTPQEVVRYDGGNIQLVPADSQVVYVPTYNPWVVYGDAVTPYPGFSLLGAIGDVVGAFLHWGPGIALSAFAHTPWGWLAWGLDWLGHALLFHDSAYYSHSATVADWGFPHHGFYAYSGRGFGRGSDFGHGWDRQRGDSRAWGNESWRHGRYDAGGWHSFNREPERRVEAHADGWNRPVGRGFESPRNERGPVARFDNRSFGRMPETHPVTRPETREEHQPALDKRAFERNERASTGSFPRAEFGGRSYERSSGFASHSSGKSHGGGLHLFGGGKSAKSFDRGHAEHFHASMRAPKGFGGGKAPKGFGGGHSHGAGHSGGHGGGGGKHHR
jgi:hypothetical protein